MAAQVSLAPSASCSSLLDVLDTISLDDHDVEAEQNILAGPTTPTPTPSSPAGAASRTGKDEDVLDVAEGRSSGDAGGGGLIHLAALTPLPALLREWSHGPAAAAAAEKQSSTPSPPRAQRTSSGTPIAVAVQNDREQDNARSDDDLGGTIPPPPPPPPLSHDNNNSSNHPQASPLWSMLQSSVTAATATATSGTAATTNAAAVLPAAALDSPPVKVSRTGIGILLH